MNTQEYIEDLAEELDMDDEELDEFVEECFGSNPAPLNPESYYFALDDKDNRIVVIFPKHFYDTYGEVPEEGLFPVTEICAHLNLENEGDSLYSCDPDIDIETCLSDLAAAGLTEMEL